MRRGPRGPLCLVGARPLRRLLPPLLPARAGRCSPAGRRPSLVARLQRFACRVGVVGALEEVRVDLKGDVRWLAKARRDRPERRPGVDHRRRGRPHRDGSTRASPPDHRRRPLRRAGDLLRALAIRLQPARAGGIPTLLSRHDLRSRSLARDRPGESELSANRFRWPPRGRQSPSSRAFGPTTLRDRARLALHVNAWAGRLGDPSSALV
jgi:hypothetical protein